MPGLHLSLRLACIALLACVTPSAHAQWSSDPASNLVLADHAGEQVQPKMVATGDGGFYVSWFDSSNGYSVYLQRLGADGVEQWPHNGVLVASRNFSSTQDYGLAIDPDGNALLSFRFNDGGGVAQILAQKVASSGALQWGNPGVFVSTDAAGANAPKIASIGGGNVAVAWSDSNGAIRVQKLSAAGTPLWAANGVAVIPPTGFFFLADLHGDGAGNVIASWSAQLSFSNRQLWAQKFAAADGANLWGATPVKLFDGVGGAMQLGNFPPFVTDGAGGAVFAWYTVGVSAATVRVQRVNAAGSAAFAQNGVEASANAGQSHTAPSGAFDPVSGDTYVLWRETDIATQGQIGVYAQRIDSSGARLWGSDGKVLVPLAALDQSQLLALPAPGGMLAVWASGSSPNAMPIRVARLANNGSYVWPATTVAISTAPTSVSRTVGAISSNGFAAFAWTATGASFTGDVHAQNINMDGSLGDPDTIFGHGFE